MQGSSTEVARPGADWIAVFRTGSVFAVIGIVWLIFWRLTPYFLTKDNLYNVGIQASSVAIIAAGLTVVLIAAEIDLSIGAIQALAGSIAAVLIIHHGAPVWIGITVALVIGPLLGFANGLVTWKLRIPSFIATLAMLGIAQGAAFLITNNAPINGFPTSYLNIGTGRTIAAFPVVVLIAIGVLLAVHLILNKTRLGRHVYAVGGDAVAASLSGISIGRVKLIALSLSGLTAAIGGLILSSRLNAGSGDFGTEDLLPAVAAVVIGGTSLFGGTGSVWGTAAGALLLSTITNGLILVNVQSAWQQIAVGLIIVGAMLLDQLLKTDRGIKLERIRLLRRLAAAAKQQSS